MYTVKLEQLSEGMQGFIAREGNEKLAEMVVKIEGHLLTAYHTEVQPSAEGKGLGKLLLNAMVTHARQKGLKVLPLCVFVQAQFKRDPGGYADIWQRAMPGTTG